MIGMFVSLKKVQWKFEIRQIIGLNSVMICQKLGSIEIEQNDLFRKIKGVMINKGMSCSCLKLLVQILMIKLNSEKFRQVSIIKVIIVGQFWI